MLLVHLHQDRGLIMGIFFRKSFRIGPIRLNLSKSGLGISAGIKGAHVGVGPKGPYVSGGKDGIYFRENLSTKNERRQETLVLLILSAAIVLVAGLIMFAVMEFFG